MTDVIGMSFSARESAVTVWLGIVVVFSLIHPSVRPSLAAVLRSLLDPKLLTAFLLFAGYTSACVLLLRGRGIWDSGDLKDTILWFVFSGVVFCFDSLSKAGEPGYFRDALVDQLRALVLFEWLINFHSFSFGVEFLLFPVLAALAMMQVIAARDEKTRVVGSFVGVLLGLIALGLATHSLRRAFAEFSPYAAGDAFKSFVVPLILTASLLPVAWATGLWGIYEYLAIRMGHRRGNNRGKREARRIMWFSRLSPLRIREFTSRYSWELTEAKDEADLSALFAKARRGEPGEVELG